MINNTTGKAVFTVTNENGPTFNLTLAGRNRWALEQLIRAGRRGCTPIKNPSPRLSAYIHNLRKLGVKIETLTERHEGPYAGTHARYVLRAQVEGGDV